MEAEWDEPSSLQRQAHQPQQPRCAGQVRKFFVFEAQALDALLLFLIC